MVLGSGGFRALKNLVFQVSHLVFSSTKVLSKGTLLHYAQIGFCFVGEEGLPQVKDVSVNKCDFPTAIGVNHP